MGITKRKHASAPVYVSPNQLIFDIAYPTDLNLLSDAQKKSEQLIDILYDGSIESW